MLTEKDYCDYETCVALKELGYIGSPQECECFGAYFNFGKDIFTDSLDNTEVGTNEFLRVPLYLAQKWLREEKHLIVDVRFGCPLYNVVISDYVHQLRIVVDSNNRIADFIEYEEALSEGIKEAIKILKEERK